MTLYKMVYSKLLYSYKMIYTLYNPNLIDYLKAQETKNI